MIALLLAVALQAPPAVAAPAAPVCIRAEVAPGFEGWGRAPASALGVGSYAALALGDATAVTFAPPLNRPATPGSFGGVFPLSIARAGAYRIALSAGAWIDVIDAAGKRVESIAHTHGPACSGIGKIVDFTLPAGRYSVQLSAAKAATLGAMVVVR